jgi:uncharacterized protein
VDWFPWGDEALTKAREEDKPILVSIGYAACHWCHVMEKESFEDPATAELMNRHFVNIKIDREERPDLDQVYMDAVQAIAGQGGWPLNVFLTPSLKPFYGGTYFPPVDAYNRASWKGVLTAIADSFSTKRTEIESQAENLTEHMQQSNQFGIALGAVSSIKEEDIQLAVENVLKAGDTKDGGFGRAPKFPQSFTIRFLLHNYYHTGNDAALKQALFTLDKMAMGGIYDQLRGGFARYSTDTEWLAPHFEKMLYDNALLISTYSEAYQVTRSPLYRKVLEETAAFVQAELMSPEGGFYAALDADSEGVEGKFYVWQKSEIESLLGDKAEIFCRLYDVSEAGNWEHANILRLKKPVKEFAADLDMEEKQLESVLDNARSILLNARAGRIRPQLDDKILLGWNALMNSAYTQLYVSLQEQHYLDIAIQNMEFLLKVFQGGQGEYFHTYKNKTARHPAFLDDYAFLIEALIKLQEATGNQYYIEKAVDLTEKVIAEFSEKETGFFFYTREGQGDIILRKKEIYDGAVPSGNSTMCWNLYYLGLLLGNDVWKERSIRMISALAEVVKKYPTSFGIWATNMQAFTFSVPEIALIGAGADDLRKEILAAYIPTRIFQSSPAENSRYPLLAGKPASSDPLIYLCKNYSCQNPVREVKQLIKQLEDIDKL